MASRGNGVGTWERVEAVFLDPAIYVLGALLPVSSRELGGRPRHYPGYMVIAFSALKSVYKSARQAEAELLDLWPRIQELVVDQFPTQPHLWLRDRPMRRYHYTYARNVAVGPATLPCLLGEFEEQAARLAVRLGLCDPNGEGSLTHPSLERTLYGDGKVIPPLYRAKRGDCRVDRQTGEVRALRADPDADLHITGGGTPAYGNKFNLIAVRHLGVHERVILAVDHVPDKGGEAAVAVDMLRRIAPRLPGAQAIDYDGAFRGVHNQVILSELGLIPIVPVHAESGGRSSGKPRVERQVRIGTSEVKRPDGSTESCQLFGYAGTVHIGELNEVGDLVLVPLERRRLIRRRNSDRTYRWYGVYELPAGDGTVMMRLDTTDEDRQRGFNRTEHVRAIPPSDPDWARLYPRRSDAESINRGINDSNYLTRAHSVGAARQLFDVLGYAIAVNALTRSRALTKRREAA